MNTNTPPASRDAMSAMRQASDEMLQTAGTAMDLAENKVRGLRGNIDPVVDKLASKAQQLALQSLDMAGEAKDRTQQSLSRAAGATTRYVSEQPLRSVLIAAVVGAAVALLVSSSLHRRQNRD